MICCILQSNISFIQIIKKFLVKMIQQNDYDGNTRQEVDDSQSQCDKKLSLKTKTRRIRWTQIENISYVNFLEKNMHLFKHQADRRKLHMFQRLSKHVKSKTPNQCKSHHQKMMKKYETQQKITKSLGSSRNLNKKKVEVVEKREICQRQDIQNDLDQMKVSNFQDPLYDVLIKFDEPESSKYHNSVISD